MPVLSPAVAFVTTQMLKDVMVYGTAKSLRKFSMVRPCAGKTGTTSDYRDAWFIGYTPHLLTGVWVGYDKPRPGGKGFTGGAIAAPIWGRFMREALAGRPVNNFPQPANVVTVSIDPETGCASTEDSPDKLDEFFIEGTEPTELCAEYGGKLLEPLIPPVPPNLSPPAEQENGNMNTLPPPEGNQTEEPDVPGTDGKAPNLSQPAGEKKPSTPIEQRPSDNDPGKVPN
jgi:membrane carboxypeptidase/penicillin-binding protein